MDGRSFWDFGCYFTLECIKISLKACLDGGLFLMKNVKDLK